MFSRKPGAVAWPKTHRVNAFFPLSGKRFTDIRVCASSLSRSRGLLFRNVSEQALLWPCASVHSIAMGHAIDVIYLSTDGVVVKIVQNLVPWRMSMGGRDAFAVLEVRAGSSNDVQLGERVSFEELQ